MWKKEEPIEDTTGGCLHCHARYNTLPEDFVIGVGFGEASVTRDGKVIYYEKPNMKDNDYKTVGDIEKLAKKSPNHDWRIHLVAPLSERHFQRQGDDNWVLYEQGKGFA